VTRLAGRKQRRIEVGSHESYRRAKSGAGGAIMLTRFVLAFLFAVSPTSIGAAPNSDPAPDTTAAVSTAPPDPILVLLSTLRESSRARDSLTVIADTTTSENAREFLEELIWEREVASHAAVIELTDKIKDEESQGRDLTEVRRVLNSAIRSGWPEYLNQIKRRREALAGLGRSSEAVSGAERIAIESRMSYQSDRLLEASEFLVDDVRALERIGADVSEVRAFLVRELPAAATGMVTRMQLVSRDRANAGERLSGDASNAELRYAFEAAGERLKRATVSLEKAVHLMDRLDLPVDDLKVALITATGRVTADVFRWKVLLGLWKGFWGRLVELLAVKAPQWLFQGALIVLTFLGFRTLSRLAGRLVKHAIGRSNFSALMRDTIVRLSTYGVMLVGFFVILTQLGVEVAPLLAGLGVAGVVVGFALQNSLSNFAAGGMILSNHPFDVGDDVEVAGVTGTVRRMSLVSTTILTADNQTLIIPNSSVWGGVIRNRTAQPIRRVDQTFSIGYGDDLEKAERVLREIVAAQANVLKEPAPVIRLHQLADSSVNFVVQVWTAKERYQEVHWDITRALKLRFDEE
jgi:small conductance mechanosensitive channel